MQQKQQLLSENEKKFLNRLLQRGNITDVEISKKTGLSKATCSRIRKKLEKTLITEYIPIVDLDKIGVEVFSVLTFKWSAFNDVEMTKKAFSAWEKDPHVIFLANGSGSDLSTVMFLGFTSIDEYHKYFSEFRKRYGQFAENMTTLLLPSKEIIKNDFTEIIKHVLGGGV